jgi:hypothetical protein
MVERMRIQMPEAVLPSRCTMNGERKKATSMDVAVAIQFQMTFRAI